MRKAYFQYYETFETICEKFKDPLQREAFRKKIIEYGLHGTEPVIDNELEDMAWTIVQELIDQQLHRREVNRQNREGKKAEKQAEAKAAEKSEAPEKSEKSEDTKPRKFEKPTVDEIKAFINEQGLKIDAETFFNYYESTGWKIGGRATMKSWRAAVLNWNARDKKSGTLWAGNSADSETKKYEDMF